MLGTPSCAASNPRRWITNSSVYSSLPARITTGENGELSVPLLHKPGVSAATELCWGGPSSQLRGCGRDTGFQPVSLTCWCLLCCFAQHRHTEVLDALQFGLLTSAIEVQGVGQRQGAAAASAAASSGLQGENILLVSEHLQDAVQLPVACGPLAHSPCVLKDTGFSRVKGVLT